MWMDSIGISGMFNIVVTLLSIGITWWCLQIINFDVLMKNAKSGQSKILQIILSIVLGYNLAKFVIDYTYWSTMLKHMF
jgi:uncharacterized integral membrane protein (TIGR02327 family)